ncbi:hypothetical protein [Pseudonocardia hydrocarbonoxydans]|uniref:Uncharacterized protein n=1 Tax=Pseudonocardia hydrocarbonoxydans TaxID=76726 RepID=A0A4Y3WP26_9PSEU|nr:hypothetical protein [Pseudonocardia hydrocarbonoxydans]GEC19116.1 hypothetical protein PHY01_13990 [Pseudonocardia hydrocarbonoxydans]
MIWTDVIGVLSCVLVVTVVRATRISPPADIAPPMRAPIRVALLMGMAITTASSSFVIVHGPEAMRLPVVIVTVLFAPGYALVVFRRLDDAVDELVLAVALSLALLVVTGTLMAGFGLWQPGVLVSLSTVVTAPALAWHATYLFLLPAAATRVPPARD